jgi:DNA-binding GntR family transcriptional regulator
LQHGSTKSGQRGDVSRPGGLPLGLAADGRPFRSLTSAVLAQLRAEILSAHLKPGEKVLIAAVAKRLGVSLSAVREALSRLAAEGLVRGEDQRGFRVSPVSIDDLRDVTRTRIDLEGLALRRAIELGDQRWEEGVRLAHAELAAVPLPPPGEPGFQFERWRALHQRYHLALVAGCGSEWLLRLRHILFEQSERYRFLAYGVEPRDIEGEHRTIMQAALARDADAAVDALRDHLALTADIILQSFASRRALGDG